MAEAPSGTDRPSAWTKLKHLIAGAAIVGGGSAAIEATVHPVETAGQKIAGVTSDIKDNSETKRNADEQYLKLTEDGTLVATDVPEIIKVVYEPNADPTTRLHNGNNIVFQRKPKIRSGDILVDPKEITAQYAVRVAGGAYGSPSDIGRFYLNGQPVGEWFQPWNPVTQQPVNFKNEPLKEGENKFYASGNEVSVKETLISEPTPIHTPTNQ